MEDSQISALPPDLAAEAQNLRRDWESRNRQMLQERLLTSSFSSVFRYNNRSEYKILWIHILQKKSHYFSTNF